MNPQTIHTENRLYRERRNLEREIENLDKEIVDTYKRLKKAQESQNDRPLKMGEIRVTNELITRRINKKKTLSEALRNKAT